jgi:hypothetical protein
VASTLPLQRRGRLLFSKTALTNCNVLLRNPVALFDGYTTPAVEFTVVAVKRQQVKAEII